MRTTSLLPRAVAMLVGAGLVVTALSRLEAAHPPGAPATASGDQRLEKATFAGGCFWCMEPPFDRLEGVVSTTSGYTGGRVMSPTYEQVSSGGTGHLEALQIRYVPRKIDYAKLLDVFWRNIDPTDSGGQFCDRGSQYQTAIFFHSEEQRSIAEKSKADLEESQRLSRPIVTRIRPAGAFYRAEPYHQDFYKRNPIRYKLYRMGCGRDRVLRKLWGASSH